MNPVTRFALRLAALAVLLSPVTVAATEMALSPSMVADAHVADDDCPLSAQIKMPCEDPGLCAGVLGYEHLAAPAGQGLSTGFLPTYWTKASDPRGGVLSRLDVALPHDRPKLSVLFCSLQT